MRKRITSLILTLACLGAFLSIPISVRASSINIGDYVQMGTYYGQPILWRCVSFEKVTGYDSSGNPIMDATQTSTTYQDGYLPLMLSDRILCLKAFDAKGTNTSGSHARNTDGYRDDYGSNYWADSNMRCWLNSTASAGDVIWTCGNPPSSSNVYGGNAYDQEAGFLTNFTDKECKAIETVTQKSLLNYQEYNKGLYTSGSTYHSYSYSISSVVQNYSSAYSEQVTDTVFPLDVKQVNTVYNNSSTLGSGYYIGKLTAECISNSTYKDLSMSTSSNWYYWLRSPYAYNNYSNYVRYVYSDGSVYIRLAYYCNYGVRPAFFLNLSSNAFASGDGSVEAPYSFISSYKCKFVDYDGTVIEQKTYTEDDTISTPTAPSRTGYTFTGWQGYTDGMKATKDATFTAQYTPNEYKITIDGFDEQSVTYDSDFTLPIEEDKKDRFLGYYTAPYGEGSQITDSDGKSLQVYSYTNDITLYAFYIVESNTVEWDKSILIEYGQSASSNLSVLANKGIAATVVELKYPNGIDVSIKDDGDFKYISFINCNIKLQ